MDKLRESACGLAAAGVMLITFYFVGLFPPREHIVRCTRVDQLWPYLPNAIHVWTPQLSGPEANSPCINKNTPLAWSERSSLPSLPLDAR